MFYGFFIFTFYTCTSTRKPMGSPQCGFIIFNKFWRQYFAGPLLRRSFLFFFIFFHVSALCGGCSCRAQLHPATYYYTRTLLPVLWFDAKASRFLFSLQDGLSVMKSPVVMASITHSCLQLMQHYLFSALSLFISDWLKFLFDWIPLALLSPYKTCKTVGLIPNRLQLWFREHFRKRELSVHSCFLMVFQKLFFLCKTKCS